MTPEQILDSLQPIFRRLFEQPNLQVTRDSSALNVLGWDSLMHITLIGEVEEQFNVRFGLGELEELTCVGDMVDLIARKPRS